MGRSHCPICYSQLEVRKVTPCYYCGGWPEYVAAFDASKVYIEYRLPNGRALVLCRGCELEEFIIPGGWGCRLVPDGLRPINSLEFIRYVAEPQIALDKFCPTCNFRRASLELLAEAAVRA